MKKESKNVYIWILMVTWVLNLIASYYFSGFMREIYDFSRIFGNTLKMFFVLLLPLTLINLVLFLLVVKNIIYWKYNKEKIPRFAMLILLCYITIILIPVIIFKFTGFLNVIYVVLMLYANLFFGVPIV